MRLSVRPIGRNLVRQTNGPYQFLEARVSLEFSLCPDKLTDVAIDQIGLFVNHPMRAVGNAFDS